MADSPVQTVTGPATRVPGELTESQMAELRESAIQSARSSAWVPGKRLSRRPRQLYRDLRKRLSALESELYRLRSDEPSEDLRWLYDNFRLVRTDLESVHDSLRAFSKLPNVRTATDDSVPRAIVLARALVSATDNRLSEGSFSQFVSAVEEVDPLRLAELGGMLDGLKIALLESLAERGPKALAAFRAEGQNAVSFGIGDIITSLRFIGERDWRSILEPLTLVHRILLEDPADVYGRMDFDSRELYRQRIAKIAGQSDIDEIRLARLAIRMAREAEFSSNAPEAVRKRMRHAGYYLVDPAGSQEMLRRVGYRPSFSSSVQRLFRQFPDEVYILGIELVALITVVALIMSIVRAQGGLALIAGALLLLVPATQAAVELVNYLVTAVLTPHALPKLDFSKSVDPDSATIVAIPTLLINDKQIRQLVEDMEVRYLVNRDPNIFYALLTDLPDTAEPAGEQDRRVDLAIELIDELNRRYASEPFGGFYLFHRHRVYNPREGTWMGWERKRGKLLDLNQLLRNVYDPFPVKTGNLAKLPLIRYVLTLDSDTQLPRGSAQRMIGAMAHPLNRPVIDPELNIVTSGYGILQPRVGISVHSASRSRLASIYSGQTGFDTYSRAVSDVYQDLYGEAIFTGKGIYDIDALRQVLEHRFPRNALLSHDLIEGAYARVGLASDIEVIDDYPSHYSAYNRRRHRWLRGDWQIVRWVLNTVPDESGRLVQNPISLVSRWKIFDNLRRSLVEPLTFLLLVAGWYVLPGGPRFWTLVTVSLLFLPIYFRLVFAVIRTTAAKNWASLREAVSDFGTSHISIVLNIAFLAHQALVSIDAVVRTIIRTYITHNRLLEWETATEAELGIRKRTPVDLYLDWVPLVAIVIGLGLFFQPAAAPYALPFLLLWAFSKLISIWLNRSPHEDFALSENDTLFLREAALRTWRYFAEYSNEKNHWLIPDNVQEQPYRIAERLSPTNLGLLFNARQAALEFGYLTLPEFIQHSEWTLETLAKLPRTLGHFLNWYDNVSLKPLEPAFVSSVDSGNLIASLWSFKEGCIELARKPLLSDNALAGLSDHVRMLEKTSMRPVLAPILKLHGSPLWLPELLRLQIDAAAEIKNADLKQHVSWPLEIRSRIEALRTAARDFMPWFLPEYAPLRDTPSGFELPQTPLSLAGASGFFDELDTRLLALARSATTAAPLQELAYKLRRELPECRDRAQALAARLKTLAEACDRLADEMSFSPLINKNRNLLSIGYDVASQKANQSCYDLLASEARTATFIAVAKEDLIQDGWFRLGRQHTVCEGETTLISWTGTMFEYLMPVLWMRSHPNTLLDRAVRAAVRAQRAYAVNFRIPWGISEAAYRKTDAEGNYQYSAFGVPGLALNVARSGSLVVSPYSSCLALMIDPVNAMKNLVRMKSSRWLTEYGFYESVDYTDSSRRFLKPKGEIIRCWMAHHQGMSLVAICNVLHDWPFQRWFHAERLVQASELILQERPMRSRPITDSRPRRVLSFRGRGPVSKPRVST